MKHFIGNRFFNAQISRRGIVSEYIYAIVKGNHAFVLLFVQLIFVANTSLGQSIYPVTVRHQVTLKNAHKGTIAIDTMLLDSYLLLPENARQFYKEARSVFEKGEDVDFSEKSLLHSARNNKIRVIGGPMLGCLKDNAVTVWIRTTSDSPIKIRVSAFDSEKYKEYRAKAGVAGVQQRIVLDGLHSDIKYDYEIVQSKQSIAKGSFTTAPKLKTKEEFRIAFGSCFHKIGLHNPNLIHQILKREPKAMMLLGDIAVDDREDLISMHRADYLLRDRSKPWQELVSHIPLYTSWDDHDYLNNDLSGVPKRFDRSDCESLRQVWQQNWNNPTPEGQGIYFSTRIGPVEIIMLDTRSCRIVEKRGDYTSYLGEEQQKWLLSTLKKSKAPYKIVSSGTMWSDAITNGKDSWGTWDTLAREEVYNLIEEEKINGVLFISGDRHGARGFRIPRLSGHPFYEFEAASLGGVPGPNAMADDPTNQIFGYHGSDIIAFGEFTFNRSEKDSSVVFRLIDQWGTILEEHALSYQQLSPPK